MPRLFVHGLLILQTIINYAATFIFYYWMHYSNNFYYYCKWMHLAQHKMTLSN